MKPLNEMIRKLPEVRKHLQDHYEKSYWHKYDSPRNIDFSQKEDAGSRY